MENGENTRFWVDKWYEGGVIKELFLRIFAFELNKNATINSKLNASSLDNSFKRKARSEIKEMQLNSLAEISQMTTLVPCEDRYVWTLESDGVFSVASIRKEIDGNRLQDVSLPTSRQIAYPPEIAYPPKIATASPKIATMSSENVLTHLIRQKSSSLTKAVCAVTHVDSSESMSLCVAGNLFTATPRKLVTTRENKGTAEPKNGHSDKNVTPTAPTTTSTPTATTTTSTPTPTTFGDDETIA
ncbi:hypothetical protein Tco_0204747 [Tanacetum coccineum]